MGWVSHRTLCAAAFSCGVHVCALGAAAGIVVSSPAPILPQPLRVVLLERAQPLPIVAAVENPAARSQGTPPPATPPKLAPLPRPKPAPAAKPAVKKKPPEPLAKPAPKPVPPPQEQTPQLAAKEDPPGRELASLTLPAGTFTNGDIPPTDAGAGATPDGAPAGDRGAETGTGGGGGGVSALPDYAVNPKPQYPLLARRLGAQGEVLLRVQVREDGSVAAVELARSSGFALLDESASRTVRESWRFTPARRGGAAIASWVEVPIKFVLEDS